MDSTMLPETSTSAVVVGDDADPDPLDAGAMVVPMKTPMERHTTARVADLGEMWQLFFVFGSCFFGQIDDDSKVSLEGKGPC